MNESVDNKQAEHVPTDDPVASPPRAARARRIRKRRVAADVALVFFAISLGIFAGLYLTREELAGDVIDSTLREYDIPARYDVVSIGPQEQVVENIVIGDPAAPDMTIERLVLSVEYRFGAPAIGAVRLEKPRLYGEWDGKRISFGALDPLLYEGDSDEPFALPDLDTVLVDGRASIRTPWGDAGLKLQGSGNLADGFDGVVGAVVPDASLADCNIEAGSLYGTLQTRDERLIFEGPLRLSALDCGAAGSLASSAFRLRAETADFSGFELRGRLNAARPAAAPFEATALTGEIALTRHADDGALVSNFDLAATGASIGSVQARELALNGRVRARRDLSFIAFNGALDGEGVTPGPQLNARLADWQTAASGTLAAPLLSRLRGGLEREGRGSSFSADLQARHEGGQTTIIVPQARWRGTSGQAILSVSRGQYVASAGRAADLAANFSTGGAGLPRITGRMEERDDGMRSMVLTMADYVAGDARLAVPQLRIMQSAAGAISLSGRVLASGTFPGGSVEGLDLPLSGGWSERGGLALGTSCIEPRFRSLRYASLTMQQQMLTLCPPSDGAIFRSGAQGTRFAAGVPDLSLSGHLGETPVQVSGGPVGFAVPGALAARDLTVRLGEGGSATDFVLAELTAELGDELRGGFDDLEVRLASVPLDITRASGEWSFADGVLTLSNAAIRVTDRAERPRFKPMIASNASLTLADNRIVADAFLHEETTGRQVVDVDILHDLGSGTGHADLDVPALRLDKGLQATDLTPLALGVVANAEGVITGEGRIDWSPQALTSTGSFTTDSLDFAAAFGPVKGLKGTIRFTDLLGLVTAPDQQISVAEINPGIPVENGIIRYALEPGMVFAFHSGQWPFLGGTLELRPVRMTLGVEETRSYVFVISGLDAARFLERLDMANLSATGTFDGVLPVIFDRSGGRIEGGFLQSRPPGGNLSYVGALSYEDMPAIANFAFDALKSLDYREMTIGMDGALEGEIVTRVRIDGVSQGEAASKNIITRKLASLPIRFNVNIRAPFYQLFSSLKSLYDPAAVRDPRELGLLREEDGALVPDPDAPEMPAEQEPAILGRTPRAEPSIHNAESETMP